MSEIRNYVITKEAKTNVITYIEYGKKSGYKIIPKKDFKYDDMIGVSEMVFINPSLIEKLIKKKCNRTLEKIIVMLNIIYEDDSDGDPPFDLVLSEIDKFKSQIKNKYANYLSKKELTLLLNKINILVGEINVRIKFIEKSDTSKKSR
jgi:hypothetical protein